MEVWKSSDRNQREWFNYISEDFGKILKDVACIWAKSNKSIYTQNPMNSIFITNFGGGKYMSPAFLLDAPLFWRPVDKFHFIINLDHMMKRGEIKQRSFDRCLFFLRKKYSYDWMLVVKRDPVLKSILEHPESNYAIDSLSCVVRYCSNVYRHYNDNITAKISIINIESELSTLLPELYLHLFEGLMRYAIGNKSR
ncbi:hypothetical protein J1N35_035630 [Gossypium stocksii]|uniref:Uncharacterized protein n=1 Tax=Gossypium stocksii TaxID=47602 RepID=A0A9D3ZRU8_9ROSI|nr:hypothetical protein J1N35_035630 [Gossypium stocksii]